MVLHPTRVSARVVALLTCNAFFSSMLELVPLQITSLRARIVTLLTSEFLPPSHHVLSGVTSCCAGVVAPCAIERFFSGSDGNVHHHPNTSNPLATSLSASKSSSTTTISPSLLNSSCRWSVYEWWILLPDPSSPPCPRPQPPPPSPLLRSTRSTHGLYSELKRVPLISAPWLNSCRRIWIILLYCCLRIPLHNLFLSTNKVLLRDYG